MTGLKSCLNSINKSSMNPIIISCTVPDWRNVLKVDLQDGLEVDLTNFDYSLDGQFCESLAKSHSMQFKLDAGNRAGFFRKKSKC